jgi:serine/threonine-protein kinase SRPK1
MSSEIATGDFLFEPHHGEGYTRDEDHLALIMELQGKLPKNIALSGKFSKDIFKKNGSMKNILKLKPWPLLDVLISKYKWERSTAQSFTDFLVSMLAYDTKERATAENCLNHSFLEVI